LFRCWLQLYFQIHLLKLYLIFLNIKHRKILSNTIFKKAFQSLHKITIYLRFLKSSIKWHSLLILKKKIMIHKNSSKRAPIILLIKISIFVAKNVKQHQSSKTKLVFVWFLEVNAGSNWLQSVVVFAVAKDVQRKIKIILITNKTAEKIASKNQTTIRTIEIDPMIQDTQRDLPVPCLKKQLYSTTLKILFWPDWFQHIGRFIHRWLELVFLRELSHISSEKLKKRIISDNN